MQAGWRNDLNHKAGLSVLLGPSRLVSGTAYDAFECQATAHRNRPAIRHNGAGLTYGELLDGGSRLAGHLRGRGVRRGDAVAVYLDRGLDYAVALVAVLQLGAAHVPLDRGYPLSRLQMMLELSGAEHVIVDDSPPVELSGPDAVFIRDGGAWKSDPLETRPARPTDLAYILFTSGSTGAPKGVRMPHRGLANLLAWQRKASPASAGSRTMQYAPLGFDVSIQEMLSTWASGGELVVLDDHRRRDVAFMANFCAELEIERLFLPYAALQPFAEWVAHAGLRFPSLREIITAGEQPLITSAMERLVTNGGQPVRLANQYGPTETHVVSEAVFHGDPRTWPRVPPAGTAVDNCVIGLLDDSGSIVPAGEEGQIYVTGAPTALGYLGQPATTSGFGGVPALGGEWAYATGDLGRIEDGVLHLHGRNDDQVKISGQRIELREIELVASSMSGVAEVAAVPVGKGGPYRRLALYLAPRRGEAIDLDLLRATLEAHLPGAAVPRDVRLVDHLPQTASGKIDRRRLASEAASGRAVEVTATSHDEALIAQQISHVLGGVEVGPSSSFVAMGGSSLQAMLLMTRLATVFDATPTVEDVLGDTSVSDLASSLRAGHWSRSRRLRAGEARSPDQASKIQEEIWAASQFVDPTAYNVVVAFTIAGRLDRQRLNRALESTVAAHQALHTVLRYTGGQLAAHRLDSWTVPVEFQAVTTAEETRSREQAFADTPFNIGADLPVRAVLLSGPEHDRLVLSVHHHAVDGQGLRILIEDLTRHYSGPASAGCADLTSPATWPASADPPDDPAAADYWRARLSGVPDGAVRWLQRPGASRSGVAAHRSLPAPTQAIAERAARPGPPATRFSRLLACFAHAAHACGAPDEIMIGVVSSRRDLSTPEQRTVGCHLGLLPLRLAIAVSLDETVASTHRVLLEALSHRHIAYSDIVAAVPGSRGLASVAFAVEDGDGRQVAFGDVSARVHSVDVRGAQFGLLASVRANTQGDGLFRVSFDTGLHEDQLIQRLLHTWQACVLR